MGSESAGLVVELDESACWGLLRSVEVGRLAVVVNHRPEIFPINFVVDHATVVFRTAGGRSWIGARVGMWRSRWTGMNPMVGWRGVWWSRGWPGR